MNKQTVELFSGERSFSKIAEKKGYKTFCVEINPNQKADSHKNILELEPKELPQDVFALWASVPCTTFSVASLFHYWSNGRPKHWKTHIGLALLLKTLLLIKKIKPKFWFIENPRGMMRKQDCMLPLHRKTVTYCQYGDFRMKPTDIWTNLKSWTPRPMCKNGDTCHESARSGERSGTQAMGNGKDGAILRSLIPEQLLHEIFEAMENSLLSGWNNKNIDQEVEYIQGTLNMVR